MNILAWFFLTPGIVGLYLAMNFTGASTYTSLSGVRKEMRWRCASLEIVGGVGWIDPLGGITVCLLKVDENGKDDLFKRCCNASIKREKLFGLRYVYGGLSPCRIHHEHGRVRIENRDACMECGACAMNCPTEALTVQAGVGCVRLCYQFSSG